MSLVIPTVEEPIIFQAGWGVSHSFILFLRICLSICECSVLLILARILLSVYTLTLNLLIKHCALAGDHCALK